MFEKMAASRNLLSWPELRLSSETDNGQATL